MRSLLVAALVLTARAAWAQPAEVFVHRSDTATATALIGSAQTNDAIISRSAVGIRISALFDGHAAVAREILLNTGEHTWTAVFERVDVDTAGFRSWVGRIADLGESHVVFTERDGVVSALINALGITYQVRTVQAGSYVLERVDISQLRDEREPLTDLESATAAEASTHALAGAADDASVIDVLMLYTPAARTIRGGTAPIEALVSQIISDTNTAFGRSGVATRVRLVGVREFGLAESSQMSSDLAAVRSSPEARALRDATRADLVQLLVSSSDQSSCGLGYLLTSLDATTFDAYSVADAACAAQYTPTHEMGHNMGSHHAPEDGASGALFPYSYGYKDPARGFRTIMAYACVGGGSCGRIPNFSNPAVPHNGAPTGTSTQNNARSINEAALTVANFRQSTAASLAAPAAPSGLTSTIVGNNVTVSWSPAPTANSYILQVGTSPGRSDYFHQSMGNATSASGLVGAGTYFWRVIALNATGASPSSVESQFVVASCVLPPAPTGFTFSVVARDVTLMWAASVPAPASGGAISYILEAGSASGLADLLVTSIGPSTSLATTAPLGAYYVRVRAQNACGTSAPSNEQFIVVQ